jgi:putative addiction module killer protein
VATILTTTVFDHWLGGIAPVDAARIANRIQRVARGNLGDARLLGGGLSEMRFFFGPGYRVYFIKDGDTVVVLLCGDGKGSQQKDIVRAAALAEQWKDQNS